MHLLDLASIGLSLFTRFGIGKLITQALGSAPMEGQTFLQHIFEPQGKVITPDFSKFIMGFIDEKRIPGLTLGIIRSDGEVEQGAWGVKSEEGERMTVDVS